MTVGPKTTLEIVQSMATNIGFPMEILGLVLIGLGCLLFLVVDFEYGLIMSFLLTGIYLMLVLSLGLPSFAAQMLFLSILSIMVIIIVINPNKKMGATI